ncbi:MAG: permease-like cell division protein FtsX [Thermodesulfovibrionia bacterium]
MRTFLYALQIALKSLWHDKWINLITLFSVTVSLLLMSIYIMVTVNIDMILNQWSRGFGIVVYLNDDINRFEEEALRRVFKDDPDILDVRYVSKEDAMKDLGNILGSHAPILRHLNENPLPSSFELRIKRDMPDPLFLEKKAYEIKKMPGVADVEYGEKWLSSLNTISHGMKFITLFLGGAIFIAVIFITYSTIKILFYRRTEEIETLKLLGATRTFIRLPFLIEGLIIGSIGGIISSFFLINIDNYFRIRLIEFMPSLKTVMMDLPVTVYLIIPCIGAIMSLIGSYLATGRIRY